MTQPVVAADPFLFDAEQLTDLASPRIVRRGIAYFKENRVTDLGWSEERVWAVVLLAYGALQPVSEEQEAGAATAAVEARVLRGRSEVEVKHVAGDPWLGTWEARSIDSAVEGRRPWRVELRSVAERINHCDCPDFATNRLGTCKHIEAVRHRLRKRGPRKFERYATEGPPASVAHLEWDVPDAPRIRLRRSHGGALPGWTSTSTPMVSCSVRCRTRSVV